MDTRRHETLWTVGRRLARLGMTTTLIACGAGVDPAGEGPEAGAGELEACSYAVATSTHMGSESWGSITFKNTGASDIQNPEISFSVPAGVTCGEGPAGWTRLQGHGTCKYTSAAHLTIGAEASYTFSYFTDSSSSFTATQVQVRAAHCAGAVDGKEGLTASQKALVEALTRIWEHNTPEPGVFPHTASGAQAYEAAMREAQAWGLATALSKAALYDAFIQHGEQGVRNMLQRTHASLGLSGQASPAVGLQGTSEDAWLKSFLEQRRDTLAADAEGRYAIDRVATYEKQRRRGNWELASAVQNDVRARDCWNGAYPDSGFTVRTLHPDGRWSTPGSYLYSCR
ncbi:chitosanase [Stigmatella erecta]|uniref:Glycosyl hydrolase family 46 n=1 Tax=Stigmatella erecta TaxID=83460 RepID=A0A1I0LCS9_9BACT|nr:chitosanase [Stigmatella erecta]SEU37946.1 Glycosyl hydrolase family 46 [Stigmatella erecta]